MSENPKINKIEIGNTLYDVEDIYKAPIDHASEDPTYGLATDEKYGHLRVIDTYVDPDDSSYEAPEDPDDTTYSVNAIHKMKDQIESDINSVYKIIALQPTEREALGEKKGSYITFMEDDDNLPQIYGRRSGYVKELTMSFKVTSSVSTSNLETETLDGDTCYVLTILSEFPVEEFCTNLNLRFKTDLGSWPGNDFDARVVFKKDVEDTKLGQLYLQFTADQVKNIPTNKQCTLTIIGYI